MIIWVGGFKFQSSSESRPKGTARLVSSYLPSKSSSPVVMEFRPSIIRQNPVINPVRRLDPNFASLSFIGLGRGSMAHCRPSPSLHPSQGHQNPASGIIEFQVRLLRSTIFARSAARNTCHSNFHSSNWAGSARVQF